MDQLIGVSAAASLTSLLPQTLRARAESGRIPIARRSPLRFRMSTILRYRQTQPALKVGRPRDLDVLAAHLSDKYARAAQSVAGEARAVPRALSTRRRSGSLSSKKRIPTCR